MKQYDKIYIPGHDGSNDAVSLEATRKVVYKPKSMISMPISSIMLQEHGPVICMTIEELSQLWNAGHSAGMEDAGATLKKPAVDFETYLQSKGINIP